MNLRVGASPSAALAGRVVLVTGASGGLGARAVCACAQAGATVVLLGRHRRRLERVYDQIVGLGGEPLLYPLDLAGAGPEDYAELARRLEVELGGLDGLLHCAADFSGLTPLDNADPVRLAQTIHVNLTARIWLSQACLPLLRRRQDAALVLVLDDPSRVAQAYWGGYGVAQLGQRGLLATLHQETAAGPVRVGALQPGPMRTPLRARAFQSQDDAAADPAVYAAACVTLLSRSGQVHRGTIWSPSP